MSTDAMKLEDDRLEGLNQNNYPWYNERHRIFPQVIKSRKPQTIRKPRKALLYGRLRNFKFQRGQTSIMPEIRTLEPDDYSRWDHFVSEHPFGTIYHTTSWQKVIRDTYRHQPFYIALEEKGQSIVGGMPLFMVKSRYLGNKLSSVPCAQYCNPLVRNQQEYNQILSYLTGLMKNGNNKYAEIKTSADFNMETEKFGDTFMNFFTYHLNLERAISDIQNNLHKSCVQRVIKKAYRSDLTLHRATCEKDVRIFYDLYVAMRKRTGTLPQPYRFFLMMWRNLSDNHHMKIFLCKKNNVAASAILNLYFRDTVIYEYGASRPEMLKYGVSHFLLWEAIKNAHECGYKRFDFGRTADGNLGLSEFKRRWGAEKIPLPYYIIPKNREVTAMHRKKTLNNLMYRTVSSLPNFTCRILGWTLYRHLV